MRLVRGSLLASRDCLRGRVSITADLLIVGGGLGGCAAALAATEAGRSVVLTEPTNWIGGQLTQQAVPPDEHRWIESFGAPRSYRALRDHIRAHYARYYPLSDRARSQAPIACTRSNGISARPPARWRRSVLPIASLRVRSAANRSGWSVIRRCSWRAASNLTGTAWRNAKSPSAALGGARQRRGARRRRCGSPRDRIRGGRVGRPGRPPSPGRGCGVG